jgi:hypothetical protein
MKLKPTALVSPRRVGSWASQLVRSSGGVIDLAAMIVGMDRIVALANALSPIEESQLVLRRSSQDPKLLNLDPIRVAIRWPSATVRRLGPKRNPATIQRSTDMPD